MLPHHAPRPDAAPTRAVSRSGDILPTGWKPREIPGTPSNMHQCTPKPNTGALLRSLGETAPGGEQVHPEPSLQSASRRKERSVDRTAPPRQAERKPAGDMRLPARCGRAALVMRVTPTVRDAAGPHTLGSPTPDKRGDDTTAANGVAPKEELPSCFGWIPPPLRPSPLSPGLPLRYPRVPSDLMPLGAADPGPCLFRPMGTTEPSYAPTLPSECVGRRPTRDQAETTKTPTSFHPHSTVPQCALTFDTSSPHGPIAPFLPHTPGTERAYLSISPVFSLQSRRSISSISAPTWRDSSDKRASASR